MHKYIFLTMMAFTLGLPASSGRDATPTLHVTDLFRPHNDPDDHWDLATQYALAYSGKIDLRGILIDFPNSGQQNAPDVAGVAQLNYVTGEAVPLTVGSPKAYHQIAGNLPESAEPNIAGIRRFLEWMRQSPHPVAIHIIGSSRDIALAARMEPELFARKCRAIYLNAGSGTPDKEAARHLEWNVALDPASYAAIFEIPCPVYWMPCFERAPGAKGGGFKMAAYGTYWRFRQSEILPTLSPRLQNYFADIFAEGKTADEGGVEPRERGRPWLESLLADPDVPYLEAKGRLVRHMWCTGGFFDSAGLVVTTDGRIAPAEEAKNPVFRFEPIDVTCTPDGVTNWVPAEGESHRFIYHVLEVEAYPEAMAKAMGSLLQTLP